MSGMGFTQDISPFTPTKTERNLAVCLGIILPGLQVEFSEESLKTCAACMFML